MDGEESPAISDAAVVTATGKTWQEWFGLLDAGGAREMSHPQIVAWIQKNHPEVSAWWQQSLTVNYEKARGKRVKYENPEGFQVSRSKTLPSSAARVYQAWEDPAKRAAWLADPGFTLRKGTPGKSLRITWVDGKTNIDVELYPKGEEKVQISVQHTRLESAGQAEAMKAYWSEMLGRLAEYLAGQE